MLVPERDAVALDMSVEDALKIVMSGGIVSSTLRVPSGAAVPPAAEEAR